MQRADYPSGTHLTQESGLGNSLWLRAKDRPRCANSVNHRREKFEYQFHSHVLPASAENARL